MFLRRILSIICVYCFCFFQYANAQIFYAGTQPGTAKVAVEKEYFTLHNKVLSAVFNYRKDHLTAIHFRDKNTGTATQMTTGELFSLILNNNQKINDGDFQIISKPAVSAIKANPASVKLADIDAGKNVSILLYNKKNNITLHWLVSLRNHSNYIQQKFIFTEGKNGNKIERLQLIYLPEDSGTAISGVADGSPLLRKNDFFAIENPMAKNDSTAGHILQYIFRSSALSDNDSTFHVVTTFGVTPPGQLRRGFLYYLERERAQAYHPFLHYNSWYDLSYDTLTLKEADCLDRIQTWSDSLTVKRGISLDGYLWDSGWDNFSDLWHFNKGLPNGFNKMYDLSKKYGASMGVWISPWGGYDEAQQKRLAGAAALHPDFERNEHGFSLSGKNYFQYFKSVAKNFIDNEGVAIFKFDGVGAGLRATGAGLEYQKDIEAFLKFLLYLRTIKPTIYLSLTVGTWPSPYWLQYGNNIWRGGGDYSFVGEGNLRQRWLNYRDHDTYKNIVLRSRLYPLNAVMNHGITISRYGQAATSNMDDQDIADDIWTFFGNGTSLQEMYIDPHKLNQTDWNVLAKAIRWSKAHQDVLADVHWVGGDPALQQVYGFAAWNPEHGTLTLRNPSGTAKIFHGTLSALLQLPEKFKGNYTLYNVVTDKKEGTFDSEKDIQIMLQPFEVKVMNIEKE